MPVYNVLMAVVELVEGQNEFEAIEILNERLVAAGFETFTADPGMIDALPHAFESEALDEQTLAVVMRR